MKKIDILKGLKQNNKDQKLKKEFYNDHFEKNNNYKDKKILLQESNAYLSQNY